MAGKMVGVILLLCGLVAGVALWYLQIHAFYDEVPATGPEDVRLTARESGAPEPVAHGDFRAIDSDSSPIRYRACFTLEAPRAELEARYVTLEDAVPLVAPGWFDCFDAEAVGEALAAREARAVLSEREIHRGVDRVIAVFPDGRAYAWNQLNGTLEQ